MSYLVFTRMSPFHCEGYARNMFFVPQFYHILGNYFGTSFRCFLLSQTFFGEVFPFLEVKNKNTRWQLFLFSKVVTTSFFQSVSFPLLKKKASFLFGVEMLLETISSTLSACNKKVVFFLSLNCR